MPQSMQERLEIACRKRKAKEISVPEFCHYVASLFCRASEWEDDGISLAAFVDAIDNYNTFCRQQDALTEAVEYMGRLQELLTTR